MINRRRSGARGTPAKVNATAGLEASEGVNSASVSDGSHESVGSRPPRKRPHDRRFGGKAAWTKMYWRWLSEQRFDFPHQQLAFEEMQKRVLEAQARVGRLEAALTEAVDAWCFAPLVRNLQVLRGIRLVSAATLVAEVGDLTRFDNPKQLMAYVAWCRPSTPAALGPNGAGSPARATRRHEPC
jgi:hypothetical protein